MVDVPAEDELTVVRDDQEIDDRARPEPTAGRADELESLRDEFVEGFNARDLEALLALVAPDVECPDVLAGDGRDALAEELAAIWERSPAALLTRGFLDDDPCAIAWLPDEDGSWLRAALVCLDCDDGGITLFALPDDADALERAEGEEPMADELHEWQDWAEWDRGEESGPSWGTRSRR